MARRRELERGGRRRPSEGGARLKREAARGEEGGSTGSRPRSWCPTGPKGSRRSQVVPQGVVCCDRHAVDREACRCRTVCYLLVEVRMTEAVCVEVEMAQDCDGHPMGGELLCDLND